ncbi:ImmA/IrrE family metallo-endopeptidase [Tissierella sp. MB52-C2]|uniref:ImmA/IrrE family metallo-endopeptidase n=1 Tax=Tissierella sp. MB52-C2 TaxID=3070999 RepID=UPI00280A4F1C|nr:ImmA/IrrE family metallo-endopeptidase [Tissierella sp. MB52-C2]WMM26705.1 ImmA/IrrE family metallo-endopeptidase [Tissierella sp. MB52-C2]
MDLTWIDEYVDGVIDYCYSRDIFEIYDSLNIDIKRVDKDDYILQDNEAIYIRSHFGLEAVFIRDNLPYRYEKFVLAHELGHALLHIEVTKAAYNSKLINRGKLEKQADYFALKLLDISIDEISYEGYTQEQIAEGLYVREESLDFII